MELKKPWEGVEEEGRDEPVAGQGIWILLGKQTKIKVRGGGAGLRQGQPGHGWPAGRIGSVQ